MQISNGFIKIDDGRWYNLDVIDHFQVRKTTNPGLPEIWCVFMILKDEERATKAISKYFKTQDEAEEELDNCLEFSQMYKVRMSGSVFTAPA